LNFWKNNETNDISGTTGKLLLLILKHYFLDGSVSGSFLSKDSLRLFQSFLCRHLRMNFDSEEKVENINSYKFILDSNNFNPYAEGFEGYLLKLGFKKI
jgi:hypothetical protein